MHISAKYIWYKTHTFVNGKPTRGLVKTLKKQLYPRFKSRLIPRINKCGTRKRRAAKMHGKAVDRAIQKWVKTKTSKVRIHSVNTFIQQCNERNWIPVAAQLPVVYAKLQLGTCIDLVVYDNRHNVFIVVEVKTGYHNRSQLVRKHKFFKRPLHHIECTQTNQHCLQALAGKQLFQQTYPEHAHRVTSCVVYLRDNGMHEYVMENDFCTNVDIASVLIKTK